MVTDTRNATFQRLLILGVGFYILIIARHWAKVGPVTAKYLGIAALFVSVALIFSLIFAWGFKARWGWLACFVVLIGSLFLTIAVANLVAPR